jgi:hypothetical protein
VSALKLMQEAASTIVSVAVAREPSVLPPPGLLRARFTVSSPSHSASARTDTVNVLVICPGEKVSVPEVAV